jgi:integrase
MARPSKSAAVDFTQAQDLTHGLIDRASCPEDRAFVVLKDSDKKGLRLRVTKAGGKHWQFETRVRSGKLFTRALGEWPTVSIADARSQAHQLRGLTEQGIDPRESEQQQREADIAAAARKVSEQQQAASRKVMEALKVSDAWAVYLEERRPHWGALHYQDHVTKASLGGVPSKRRGQTDRKTKPGPLAPLMGLRLKDLDAPTIERWAAIEGKDRPTSARLALRLLTVFLNWCGEHPEYSTLVPAKNPATTRKTRGALGKPGVKDDVLTKEQLSVWFAQVRQIANPVVSAALQTMLLTGARPGEVLSLRWDDLNTQWRGLSIRDKVDGAREIPLTPYVASLLASLPRRNGWVFSSARVLRMDPHNVGRREAKASKRGTQAPTGSILETSATGQISDPNTPHARACKAAGLEGLTLHGLRRSFSSLTEWLEIPAGVVAQIQGHKPSATAEKHYKRRPLDLLRVHHERIEAWILEQAGVQINSEGKKSSPQAVF